jgi:uncharacterized membrane protein
MISYYIKLYLATFIAFFVIDIIWLGLVARRFYDKHLGFLLTDKPLWSAAIVFYLLFVAGVLILIVLPGLNQFSTRRLILHGAFFGLVAYGTYDLTNLALVKGWPWIVTVVDMCWGGVLAAITSYIGLLLAKYFSH